MSIPNMQNQRNQSILTLTSIVHPFRRLTELYHDLLLQARDREALEGRIPIRQARGRVAAIGGDKLDSLSRKQLRRSVRATGGGGREVCCHFDPGM
ncbi:hypothetical protein ACFX2I_043900 [Malus domestica]